jgi:hypothetical protein
VSSARVTSRSRPTCGAIASACSTGCSQRSDRRSGWSCRSAAFTGSRTSGRIRSSPPTRSEARSRRRSSCFARPCRTSRLAWRSSSAGWYLPEARASIEAPGWSGFSYLAATQALIKEDDLLFHANIGVSAISAPGIDPARLTWGVGAQVETVFDFHLIAEIFSGDPYAAATGGAYQAGFRIIFNDHLQLDGTWGEGIWGDTRAPLWFSTGIRVVSHTLF